MDNKKYWIGTFILIGIIVLCFTASKYINGEISEKLLQERESYAKQLADKTLELENNRIEQEKILKEKIISLETEKQKCFIQLDEINKKKDLKELSKKDPKRFRKTVEETLGVKGKK